MTPLPARPPPGQRRRTLRDPVRAMIAELSGSYGKCFATEAGLRRELWRRTGYRCGERSIGRVIKRGVAAGELGQERVYPNGRMANGHRTLAGTTHTWTVTRAEARKARRRAREEERQKRQRAAKAERVRLEEESRARAEEHARDRRRQEARAVVPLALGAPELLAALHAKSEHDAPAKRLEDPRARIDAMLDALKQAGFDVDPKKPPDE